MLQRAGSDRCRRRRLSACPAERHRLTSTTTTRPTRRRRSLPPPARSFAANRSRARATSCGACSPTSKRTLTCSSTATAPTTRPRRRTWSSCLLRDSLDMVNGARVATTGNAYRTGHAFGNKLLTGTVAFIFGNRIRDMLSGYRVLSRRFVKSFPALATGFETETELTVHALELRLPIVEVDTPYRDRPAGSASKLRTVRDGFRILKTIVLLVKEERPLRFFAQRRRPAGLDVGNSGVAATRAIHRYGIGSAVSDGHPVDGLDAPRVHERRRRPRARYRDARPPRDQAFTLPLSAGSQHGRTPEITGTKLTGQRAARLGAQAPALLPVHGSIWTNDCRLRT